MSTSPLRYLLFDHFLMQPNWESLLGKNLLHRRSVQSRYPERGGGQGHHPRPGLRTLRGQVPGRHLRASCQVHGGAFCCHRVVAGKKLREVRKKRNIEEILRKKHFRQNLLTQRQRSSNIFSKWNGNQLNRRSKCQCFGKGKPLSCQESSSLRRKISK